MLHGRCIVGQQRSSCHTSSFYWRPSSIVCLSKIRGESVCASGSGLLVCGVSVTHASENLQAPLECQNSHRVRQAEELPSSPINSLPKPNIAHALRLLGLNPNSWTPWHSRNLACPHAQYKTWFLLEEAASGQLCSCSLGRFHGALFILNRSGFLETRKMSSAHSQESGRLVKG